MNHLDELKSADFSNPEKPPSGIDGPEDSINIKSQIKLVIRIALTVSLCELLVVGIVYVLLGQPSWLKIFFDAGLMIVFLSPVLYFAVIRPMVRHILEQKRSEEQLKRHGHQLEDLVNQHTAELSAANESLKQEVRERATAEHLMRERTAELDDYIRQLQCLYAISRLMERQDIAMEELISKTIGLIPFAWLNPESIGVRVTLREREFKTDGFRDTEWKQAADILVHGQAIGSLEVAYLGEQQEANVGPFLKKEDTSLIEAVSERLSGTLERMKTAEKLNYELKVNAALSDLYKPLIAPSATISEMADTVLVRAKGLTKSHHGFVSPIDPLTGDTAEHNYSELLSGQCCLPAGKKTVSVRPKNEVISSLWRHSLDSPEGFFTNSPQAHPSAAGAPKEHAYIQRFLSVPVVLGGEIVGQIAVANKEDDYTEQDLAAVRRVAEFYALALQRSRVERALQKSKNDLEKRVEERTAEIALANEMLKEEIEERKLAESQLRQNRTMLQSVFDGIAHPLVLVDRNMTVKIINRAAADYYRIANYRDTIGKLWHEAGVNTEFFESSEIPSAVLYNQVFSFERKGFMNPARLERVFIYPVEKRKEGDGDAIIHITDITEERRIEKQLIQSEKMASLGILVSSIAHEINNPNSFVSFNIPILKEYIEELMPFADEYAARQPDLELFNMSYADFREDLMKIMDNIEHGSKRISSFVSNLREFAQYDGKKPKNWVDLKSVIDKVLSICGSSIKKTVRSFDLMIPHDFPAIYTDPHVLEQVLLNLLMNASQAVDKNNSWVKLSASSGNNRRDHTIIEVSDNGCGMDEETKRYIFNPFYTTKSPADGTGLGLYVCHNLIQGIGGYIEVSSEPGMGSTFRVILPDKDYPQKQETGELGIR